MPTKSTILIQSVRQKVSLPASDVSRSGAESYMPWGKKDYLDLGVGFGSPFSSKHTVVCDLSNSVWLRGEQLNSNYRYFLLFLILHLIQWISLLSLHNDGKQLVKATEISTFVSKTTSISSRESSSATDPEMAEEETQLGLQSNVSTSTDSLGYSHMPCTSHSQSATNGIFFVVGICI